MRIAGASPPNARGVRESPQAGRGSRRQPRRRRRTAVASIEADASPAIWTSSDTGPLGYLVAQAGLLGLQLLRQLPRCHWKPSRKLARGLGQASWAKEADMRRTARPCRPAAHRLPVSIGSADGLRSGEDNQGPATLTVDFNKGTRAVNVAISSRNLDMVAPTLHVVAWQRVNPGACTDVYDFQTTAYIPLRRFAPGLCVPRCRSRKVIRHRSSTIPDVGSWTRWSTYPGGSLPGWERAGALASDNSGYCVPSSGPVDYSVPFNSDVTCASQHPRGVQGALTPIAAQRSSTPPPGPARPRIAGEPRLRRRPLLSRRRTESW